MTFSVRAPRALIATVTALLLAFGAAMLAPAARGQEPSPSPSPSGSAPAAGEVGVTLLNPSTGYDSSPKVSNRFDGVDTAYTIVARTTGDAQSLVVEASIAPQNDDGTWGNEVLVGELERVAPGSDLWEFDWDIPASIEETISLLTVRAYVETPSGFVETGADSVEVDVYYSDPSMPPLGAYETVDIAWPAQNGVLGFYKPRVGAWRTMVDGTTSPGANFAQVYVSTSRPGDPVSFTPCGSAPTVVNAAGTSASFAARCSLDASTPPSAVTAVAAQAEYRETASSTRFMQAADVRSVRSYDVSPEDMQVAITPVARRVLAPARTCQSFTVTITDEHDRLIMGANVDIHATGPADELILAGTGLVVPEGHSREMTSPCPSPLPVEPPAPLPIPTNPRPQGDHNVPGGIDSKHMETNLGTGLDTLSQLPGQTAFTVASELPGFTQLTAWVDDEEIAREADQRPIDNDRPDEGEPFARAKVQWLVATPTLSFDPLGGTAPATSCFPYVVKARSGTDPVPDVNVDVHATGPDPELDFCDPEGASPRQAPLSGAGANSHEAEETSESHHFSTTGPPAQHTEGTTDPAGNFVVGLTSPVTGDTSVVAWIDGEPGADDDVQGSGEPLTSGTISWVTSAAEADLSFVNPSPYGGTTGGAGTGTQLPDSGGVADVLVRVDLAASAESVEIMLSRNNGATFETLGEAQRVGTSDLYRLEWPINLTDGTYRLRARITGTQITEDVTVTVGAGDRLPMVPNPPFETLEIRKPEIAAGAPFSKRSTLVAGRASAGADGVDVYYTKVPAKDTPRLQDWIFCGYAGLDGSGTAPQDFSTPCTLTGSDQAGQVTGIAAITYDCTAPTCDADPFPEPPADGAPPVRAHGQKDTGQALRVFGYEAHPLLGLEPAEAAAVTDECRRFQVFLRDQTGQPIGGANADLHLDGGSPAHFCRPAGSPGGVRAPDDGGHTTGTDPAGELEAGHADGSPGLHAEGETLPDGSLVFGVISEGAGDVQLTAWLDRDDDDVRSGDDPSDISILHVLEPTGGCSILGSEGPDVLRGTPGADVFCGLEGNDVIKGRGGDDTALGGQGRDRLVGGPGRDSLRAGRGRDFLDGGRGRDTCKGGPGRDRIVRCETASREPKPRVAPRRSGV